MYLGLHVRFRFSVSAISRLWNCEFYELRYGLRRIWISQDNLITMKPLHVWLIICGRKPPDPVAYRECNMRRFVHGRHKDSVARTMDYLAKVIAIVMLILCHILNWNGEYHATVCKRNAQTCGVYKQVAGCHRYLHVKAFQACHGRKNDIFSSFLWYILLLGFLVHYGESTHRHEVKIHCYNMMLYRVTCAWFWTCI